jgi:hypothetical protein
MAQTLKFGKGTWATKKGSTLAYSDTNNAFKPLPFTYTGFGKGTRVNKEGLIEVVENDRPRIDYTDSEDGVFLLEKAATNSITYSEDFTQSIWYKSSSGTGITPIVTSDYAISPDGTQNATRVQFDNGVGTTLSDFTFLQTTYSSISTASLSIWIKSNDSNNYDIALRGSNFVVCNVTPKWQKFELNNQTNQIFLQLILRGTYGTSNNADILIYGAQAENNSAASSYIPTQGSIQTRVQETASGSGNSEVFNDSEGVLFVDTAALSDDGTNRYISLSDGGVSNRVNIFFDSNNNLRGFYNGLSGSITINTDITLNNKIAFKYKSGNSAFWFNGFEVATRTDALSLSGLNSIAFDLGSGSDFYGKTKEIAYYDEVLTDLELETLTSYRTWESMVKELNLNIIHNE